MRPKGTKGTEKKPTSGLTERLPSLNNRALGGEDGFSYGMEKKKGRFQRCCVGEGRSNDNGGALRRGDKLAEGGGMEKKDLSQKVG